MTLLNMESMIHHSNTTNNPHSNAFITIEMLHADNIKIIGKEDTAAATSIAAKNDRKRQRQRAHVTNTFDQMLFSRIFASGNCFTHSMLHSILCQAFYDRGLLRICRRLGNRNGLRGC